MNFFRWFPRPEPSHIPSNAAELWAASRFPTELRSIAAFVADILCDNLGVDFNVLNPHSNFIEDLGMDDLEPVEVVMALEEHFAIAIPDSDTVLLNTIADLVAYLYTRIDEQKTGNG